MSINVFKLEEYLAKYEFSAPYLLCCSDAESFSMREIIDMASPEDRALWDNLRLSYTECLGLPALRAQIASSLYPMLDARQIICFAGAEEGIFCALYTLCKAGDNAIVLTPCYQSLAEIPRFNGGTVTEIELREENSWRIDVEEIARAIKPNTTCIVTNFPHNPTGQIITQAELEALVALCAAHDIWLFSDEVYRLLGNPNSPWASPAAELYHKALSLGVMSKAFGMAGLRIGWIACQDREMLKKLEYVKHYTSICNSAPAEIISLIALKNKDAILARNNGIVADNLVMLDDFMAQYQDTFSWVRPEGGCVAFIKYKAQSSVEHLAKQAVESQGVLLLPGSIYDHSGNHFRIGFGRKDMPEALARFKDFLGF